MSNAVEFIVKTNILFEYYKDELLTSKLIANNRVRIWAIFALFFIFSGVILLLLNFLFKSNPMLFITSLGSTSIGIYLTKVAIKKSEELSRNSYPEYDSLNQDDFIQAYRCDKIREKIVELEIPISDQILGEIINYYERKGETIKLNKWWPITLAIVILLPLWNEFISHLFDFGIGSFMFMFLSVIGLFYISTFITGLLKTFYLSKANEYKNLAESMKLVKVLLLRE
ncbi:hypothetical protein [Paenibacillus glacialis]|uniref:Uncharacterized protein n=1 Tax=Paenibacillus glacialis TaxID=494026 RepID=A0A168MCN8_9BACL|nr:hypothetical protein [Paenibacillus glacialis]OAB44517.1 hypothetical protein PGLA_07635 [Paenibacillus glacialis]